MIQKSLIFVFLSLFAVLNLKLLIEDASAGKNSLIVGIDGKERGELYRPLLPGTGRDWEVLNGHSFSDHRYISFSLGENTDWDKFRHKYYTPIPFRLEKKVETADATAIWVKRITKALND